MTPVPKDVSDEYHYYVAKDMAVAGKYRKALAHLVRHVPQPEGKNLLLKARLLRSTNHASEALPLLNSHLKQYPRCPVALEILVLVLMEMAETTKTTADYRRLAETCERQLALTSQQRLRGCCRPPKEQALIQRGEAAILLCYALMQYRPKSNLKALQRAFGFLNRAISKGYKPTVGEHFAYATYAQVQSLLSEAPR